MTAILKQKIFSVLAPLLCLNIALISIQVRGRSGEFLIKEWVLGGTAPVVGGLHWSLGSIQRLWRNYVDLRRVRSENLQLKERIETLRLQLARSAESAQAGRRLQSLFGLHESLSVRAAAAEIIAKNPFLWSNTIVINKGRSDGLRRDLPVVVPEGVVGRIITTSDHHAVVQLITNSGAAAGAMLEDERVQGVASGTGEEHLWLNYIANRERVQEGDLVVTSGMDNLYHKGLPIGKVVQVQKTEQVFQKIKVKPLANFERMEEVLVLFPEPSPPVAGSSLETALPGVGAAGKRSGP